MEINQADINLMFSHKTDSGADLWATPEGNLVADDPHQQKLDLKSVSGASDTPVANLKTA